MAAAMANGGDGCARGSQGREGKREPEEGERSRGRGENEGRLWVSPWRREDVGEAATAKQEVEASACARACGVRPPDREEDDRGGGDGLGWPGGPGGLPGERQVRFLSSVFYFCFFYLSTLFCVVLV